jgi:hypothetical protein
MNAIAIGTMAHRYGWGWGLSTAAAEQHGRRFWELEPRAVQGAYQARIGGIRSKKGHVRKLSFATNHLFPYVVPEAAATARELRRGAGNRE